MLVTRLRFDDVDRMICTISIQMTVGEARKLREQLGDKSYGVWPISDFKNLLQKIIGNAEKEFYESASEDKL